jgi:hypothetical protein
MLQGSHTGPTLVISWGGSPTWSPLPPPARYLLPPPQLDTCCYCLEPTIQARLPALPPPPSGQGYWPPPPWAPPVGGQAMLWGMPPWMTPMPQPQRPSSLPLTVSHLCLLSIVQFIIWANVERLVYSSIYVFKRHSSAGPDFINRVLNMGGSSEGKGSGTGNDAPSWSSCAICDVFVVKRWLCIVVKTMNCRCDICLELNCHCFSILSYCMCPVLEAPHPGRQPK